MPELETMPGAIDQKVNEQPKPCFGAQCAPQPLLKIAARSGKPESVEECATQLRAKTQRDREREKGGERAKRQTPTTVVPDGRKKKIANRKKKTLCLQHHKAKEKKKEKKEKEI